ncbi:MAG: hypothetical protein GY865_01975 [candidate division Zixibacteria bacterium]|nr:hypothetical protein [candidate division Zixibacteria bacterium]
MITKREISSRIILLLVFLLSLFFVPIAQADYCGDTNKDGEINILDIVKLINHKYKGAPPPMPEIIGDVDQSTTIDIVDIVYLIDFKYKGGPPPDCGIFDCTSVQGVCKSGGTSSGEIRLTASDCLRDSDGDNGMYVEMIEGDLYVYHENAYYNCCLDYRVEFVIDGSSITAYEYDDGEPCDCNCYFDLESVLEDLEPEELTTYTVTLIGIDGLPVGTDIVEPEDFNYMSLNLVGYDLQVFHKNAYYNCCVDYQVTYSIMGNGINIFEYDIGTPCYCMCFFDLETIIEDIPTGQYFVTLFDFDGDTVGHESIEIVPFPELTDYLASDCIDKARVDIDYLFDNGTLIMTHYDAYFFCAADFEIEFEIVQDTLRFYENNISSGMTTCKCDFELSATISNLPPGSYVTEIYQKASPFHDYELYDRRNKIFE